METPVIKHYAQPNDGEMKMIQDSFPHELMKISDYTSVNGVLLWICGFVHSPRFPITVKTHELDLSCFKHIIYSGKKFNVQFF